MSSYSIKNLFKTSNITKRRRSTQAFFLLLYFLFPFFNIFYIDLEKNTFVLLGTTIGINHSIIFLSGLTIILLGVILMAITTGRSFCGWVCPQNFISEMLNKIINKFAMKGEKKDQKIYFIVMLFTFLFSLIISLNFLFYFGKTADIFHQIINFNLSSIVLIFGIFFFILVFSGIGIFRHDFCKYACPYGIMQAAVSDKATVRVRFEKERSKDCIDCGDCTNICYMGIEPRKLFQNDPGCMNCGLCIEACHNVLEPLNRKTMLNFSASKIDETSINSKAPIIIGIMLISFIGYFLYLFLYLPKIDISISRDDSVVSIIDKDDNINSKFMINLLNQTNINKQIYLKPEIIDSKYMIIEPKNISIEAGEKASAILKFKAPKNALKKGINSFSIKIIDKENNKELNEMYSSVFIPFD